MFFLAHQFFQKQFSHGYSIFNRQPTIAVDTTTNYISQKKTCRHIDRFSWSVTLQTLYRPCLLDFT